MKISHYSELSDAEKVARAYHPSLPPTCLAGCIAVCDDAFAVLACSTEPVGAVGATCSHRGPQWLDFLMLFLQAVVEAQRFRCQSSISGDKVTFLLGVTID